MAEPDYGTASWAPLTTGSGHQGAELAAPLLSAHAPFQQQLPPLYGSLYLPMNSHPISQNRSVPDGPAGSQLQQDRSPYPPMGSRYPYYPPQVFSYQFTGPPRPPPAFWHGSEQLHPDQSFSNTSNTMQGYQPIPALGTPPQRHQFPETLNAGGPPFARRRYDQRNAVEALARNSHAGGIRTPYHGNRDSAPEDRLQSTRLQPHEHRQPNDQTRPASGYRPWMSPGDHGRRSDRSISPRTSNRRNFERYSVDLSPSSTSSDAEEAAARAPPPSRMRHRPREVRPRFAGYRPHIDPNIATPRQIQELKDGLPRRLPSELPDDASKACDICQKDYSSSHVSPTEEEEIAVVLSCGHSFGEFCIFQWFDTCRTHKNKVTCPMCRKQLIETPRYLQTMMHAFPRNGQAFVDLLAREQLLINGIPRDFHNL